jgi:acyl-CoA reductase-like NAD-dependent aldehyde dehydrogenase
VQHTEKLIVGDPLSESTDIGPLVNNSSMNNMDSIVKDGLKKGAELLTGGERMGSKGWFYKPTLLTNVTTKMRISQEEVFGPVAPITVVDNEQDYFLYLGSIAAGCFTHASINSVTRMSQSPRSKGAKAT